MTAPRQLALPLAYRPAQGQRDFLVSDSNRAAFDAVTQSSSAARFAVSGPEGAGKSHLASIWGARTGAVCLPAADLSEGRIEQLFAAPAVVLEDGEAIGELPAPARRQVERLLFHVLNVAAAEGHALMLTGRAAPARWPVETPDLASRLAALAHVAILPPDDALLVAILRKLFRDRQVTVEADVLEFLAVRMERSFAAAEDLAARLDRFALATRRKVTEKLAREFFAQAPDETRAKTEG